MKPRISRCASPAFRDPSNGRRLDRRETPPHKADRTRTAQEETDMTDAQVKTTHRKRRVFSGVQPTGNLHLGNYGRSARDELNSKIAF